jgi:hypothetical protein
MSIYNTGTKKKPRLDKPTGALLVAPEGSQQTPSGMFWKALVHRFLIGTET